MKFEVDIPDRMTALVKDQRGFPIPWFVEPADPVDFRVLRANALLTVVQKQCCWICGQPLGQWRVHVLGPMLTIQKITTEGACHRECAEFAVKVCPFIANPNMRRSPREFSGNVEVSKNDWVLDNPGTYALWITKGKDFDDVIQQRGQILLKIAQPSMVFWYREKQLARREEIRLALLQGLQTLVGHNPVHEKRYIQAASDVMRFLPTE